MVRPPRGVCPSSGRERTRALAGWESVQSSRRRFAVLALVLLGALFGCAGRGAPSSAESTPPPRLELHVLGGEDHLVLDGEIRAIRLVRDPERDGIALSVELADAAREGVAQFTGRHVGERVEIIVGGRSVAKVAIRDPVQVPALLLTGTSDDEVRRMQRDLATR
jgi:hypothetical protein